MLPTKILVHMLFICCQLAIMLHTSVECQQRSCEVGKAGWPNKWNVHLPFWEVGGFRPLCRVLFVCLFVVVLRPSNI